MQKVPTRQKDLAVCGVSNVLYFLRKILVRKEINNLQMYQRNACDVSQIIIVENEMKMDLINIINLLYVRT